MKALIPFSFNKEILAIDFGSHSIKIVVGRQEKEKVIVSKTVTLPIAHEYYADGRILDAKGLEHVLGNALKEQKIKAKSVVCTLESNFVITREIVLPAVGKEDLHEMVQYEIGEFLPIELNKYVIQHKIIDEFVEEGVSKYRLLVAALPAEIAFSFYELMESLDLTPVALDLHGNSISKLLSRQAVINETEALVDKTIAVLDIGHSHINVVIIENGSYKFSRIVNAGAGNIPEQSVDQGEREYSLNEVAATNEAALGGMTEVIRANVDYWVEEINRVFRYYTSRSSEHRINRVFIYGGGSRYNRLEAYMSQELQILTTKINHINHLQLSDHSEGMSLFLNAIGALVREEQSQTGDFNFFQPYIKEPERTNLKRLAVISAATVIGFAIIIYPIFTYMELRAVEAELLQLKEVVESSENLDRIQAIESKNEQLTVLLADQSFLSEIDGEMQAKEKVNDLLFRELLFNIPDGIYFQTVSVDNQNVAIRGQANERLTIAQMEYQLRQSKSFDQVFVSDITGAEDKYAFSLTFAIKDVNLDVVE